VYIYKAIIESKLPFSRLGVKIPETLAVFDGLSWIDYDYKKGVSYIKDPENWAVPPQLKDRSKITPDTKFKGFVDSIEYADTIYYNHLDINRDCDPAWISRSWSAFPVTQSIDVVSWEQAKMIYSYGPGIDAIIQRFVYSPTHKATLYRLVYYNRTNNCESKSNYGFWITNKKDYFAPKSDMMSRTTHDNESVGSFVVYNINGKAIVEFEQQAKNLSVFLERSYRIKITEIVCDFVKDELGNSFLINVKSFKLLSTELFNSLARMSEKERVEHQHMVKLQQEKANKTVQCQLCRIYFRKSDITKIVSMNMLFSLKQHLNKRGIFKFEYLERFRGQQLSWKVCDLWYLLVVAEDELREVEKLFGKALNIPVDEEEVGRKKIAAANAEILKDMESKKISSDRFDEKLLQWRVLFFFHDVIDISLSELSAYAEENEIYLQLKMFDFVTTIQIYNKKRPNESPKKPMILNAATPATTTPRVKIGEFKLKNRLIKRKTDVGKSEHLLNFGDYSFNSADSQLHKMRVHYFFTEKDANFDDFFENTEIEIRITDGQDWDKKIARATWHPFIHFKVILDFNH
jgi:hypothetical protein